MTLMAAVRMSAVAVLASILVGCSKNDSGIGDNGAGGDGLTGTWTVNQAIINNATTPTALLGTATLTINADGTLTVVATPIGSDPVTYTGTYTTSGNIISVTVPAVPASAGVAMPVTATYSVDSDSLEITLTQPITVSTYTVSAVFLVR